MVRKPKLKNAVVFKKEIRLSYIQRANFGSKLQS
jgi:hypothetical protein